MIYIGDIDPIINLGNESDIEIYNDNYMVYPSGFVPYPRRYLTFMALESGTTFSFTNDIDYSVDDGNNWVTLSANTASPSIESGDTIIWRETLTPTSSGIGTFSSTGRYEVNGNAMSLLYGDNFVGQTSLADKPHAFHNLFRSNVGIRSAENLSLPATTLSTDCYRSMFQGCTSLTTAPELPATTLANYCYSMMFRGCTSLTEAPDLPATTLGIECYIYMFLDCTSLTTAPELPATTLADRCYFGMFRGCSNLNYIKMLATTLGTNSLFNWCIGVSAIGTFVKAASQTSLPRGENGIPANWTVINV